MEEKKEYKLCPYCKSIYIPTENYCCKHCYEKSFIIRRDVYAQIQSKNKKGSNGIIKLQIFTIFKRCVRILCVGLSDRNH